MPLPSMPTVASSCGKHRHPGGQIHRRGIAGRALCGLDHDLAEREQRHRDGEHIPVYDGSRGYYHNHPYLAVLEAQSSGRPVPQGQ